MGKIIHFQPIPSASIYGSSIIHGVIGQVISKSYERPVRGRFEIMRMITRLRIVLYSVQSRGYCVTRKPYPYPVWRSHIRKYSGLQCEAVGENTRFLCHIRVDDLINNGGRTEWGPIRPVISRVINKIERLRSGSMTSDRIEGHKVLLALNHITITISHKRKKALNSHFKMSQLHIWKQFSCLCD